MPPKQTLAQKRALELQRKKDKELEEAAAAQTLQREMMEAEKRKREEAKKQRALERAAEEEELKRQMASKEQQTEEEKAALARARAEEAKRAFEVAKQKAIEESLAKRKAAEEEAARLEALKEAARLEALKTAGSKGGENINELLIDLSSNRLPTTRMESTEENAEDADGDTKMGGDESDEEEESAEEVDIPVHSPVKKKTKKQEKREKKEQKKAEKLAKKAAELKKKQEAMANKEKEKEVSILKTNRRYSGVGTKVSEARKQHKHKFQRQIIETSIVLDATGGKAEKMSQFTAAFKNMLANCLLLDPYFQVEPRDLQSGKIPLYHQDDVSSNHAVLSFHVRSSGGGEAFEMQKPRKKDKDDEKPKGQRRNTSLEEDDRPLVDPQVYFNFACSCDMKPMELFDCISVEWSKYGGAKIYLKEFNTFETETAVMMLKCWNRLNHETFREEFQGLFQAGKDYLQRQAEENGKDYEDYERPIPKMGIRLANPKLAGQDTSVFRGWNTSKQFLRKCFHVEVEKAETSHVHEVVKAIKEARIVDKFWGKNVHLSNIERDDNNRIQYTAGELKRLSSMARDHVNFQTSMRSDVLAGVESLDKLVEARDPDSDKVVGRFTLRHILYNYLKMSDGHSLFVEIHQKSPISDVEVIIPNIPEAKSMLEQMNKNLAAYLYHYLGEEHDIDDAFLKSLMAATTCAAGCHQIHLCKWESKTWTLTTPQDAEDKKRKEIQSAAWYRDEFGDHMEGREKKEQPAEFANEDFLYDQDAEKSTTTIHTRKGAGATKNTYSGSPGAAAFRLGRPSEVAKDDDASKMSELSMLSKGDLVDKIKRLELELKHSAKQSGPPPKPGSSKSAVSAARGAQDADSIGSSSSSNSRSTSSGSSSSDLDEPTNTTKEGTPTPSVGGSAGASQAAHGE